jgi:DnaJ-domain-containing protein 1
VIEIPESSYPLKWPIGWARAQHRHESAFYSTTRTTVQGAPGTRLVKRAKSMSDALDLLYHELQLMRVSDPVVSTNVRVRLDGAPMSRQAQPQDPGAAIYFMLKTRAIALACDKWYRVEDNVYAIAKHIEAIRAQERWGVGRIEQAFGGYMALMDLRPWWDVLGVDENASRETVEDRWRALAKKHHPDAGGDAARMAEINAAWDNAKLAREWR